MAYYLYKKIRDRASNPSSTSIDEASMLSRSNLDSTAPVRLHDMTTGEVIVTATSDRQAVVSLEAQARRREEKKDLRRYRWRLLVGLAGPALVQALNMTMIANALPTLAAEFGEFAQLNWIVAAYALTSAAFIPAWAQTADIFGRYFSIQVATTFMILGSAICAGSPTTNFPMLLAGRGLQGVGSAGILILQKTVLADKVSLRESAKNNTFFVVIIGTGYGVGPIVGGALTSVSWRWVFIINIPIAVVGLVLTYVFTRPILLGAQDTSSSETAVKSISPSDKLIRRITTIDFGGQVLFFFGIGLIVLALTWAGPTYAWSDIHVAIPLSVGLFLIVLFFVWEYLLLPGKLLNHIFPTQKAMIPFHLMCSRDAGLLMYINVITGMSMYAVLYFVDIYFTLVQDFSTSKAGTSLLYYTPGLGVGTYLAIFMCNRYPRSTWPPLAFGTLIEAVGVTLLAAAIGWGHLPTIYGMLGLTGVGTGVRFMPGTLHGVGYYRKQTATIVALMAFSLSFGSIVASTLMLNIFNNLMSRRGFSLDHIVGANGDASKMNGAMATTNVTPSQRSPREAARESIEIAFYAITSFLWLGLVAVPFLGNVNITHEMSDETSDADDMNDDVNLTKGAYLWTLLRRGKSERRGIQA